MLYDTIADAYDGTSVRTLLDLAQGISGLAVIHKDLRVRADTDEVVSGWRVLDVLDELRMGLDGLWYMRPLLEHRHSLMRSLL